MIFEKINARILWLDGRIGHTTYLMFFLTFVNFIIISFNFLIEDSVMLKDIIPSMWIFSTIFIITYIPISILIGRWHRYTQLTTEYRILHEENPVIATMMKILLDVQTGVATKEEIAKVKKMMTDIENNTFKCVVTTAKNSFREGLSTIFHSVGHGENVDIAKFMYKETLTKSDRQKLHTYVCEIMDSEGRNGETFKSAFSTVIDKLETQDLLLHSESYIVFDSILELLTKTRRE